MCLSKVISAGKHSVRRKRVLYKCFETACRSSEICEEDFDLLAPEIYGEWEFNANDPTEERIIESGGKLVNASDGRLYIAGVHCFATKEDAFKYACDEMWVIRYETDDVPIAHGLSYSGGEVFIMPKFVIRHQNIVHAPDGAYWKMQKAGE